MPESDRLRDLERTRLSHLVERRIAEADAIHAPDGWQIRWSQATALT
jgi:hypothetical protein